MVLSRLASLCIVHMISCLFKSIFHCPCLFLSSLSNRYNSIESLLSWLLLSMCNTFHFLLVLHRPLLELVLISHTLILRLLIQVPHKRGRIVFVWRLKWGKTTHTPFIIVISSPIFGHFKWQRVKRELREQRAAHMRNERRKGRAKRKLLLTWNK